jgi:DNA-binding GntR family transcriptional regulator
VAAADSILDRVQGKPTVRVESTVVHSDDPVAEYNRLLLESEAFWAEHERTRPLRPLPGPAQPLQ